MSTSWRGVLRYLGLSPGNGRAGRLIKDRCNDLGIDHSHFRSRRWRDVELQPVIESSTTWIDVMRALGYARDSGSARQTVRAHCARLGVDVTHLDGGALPPRPDLGTIRPEHLRAAGSMIVSATLTLRGWRVSWPLEPAAYDIVADMGDSRLHRVQVKTTTQRQGTSWVCQITRHVYDSSSPGGHRRQVYDPGEIDQIAVVDGDLTVYLIPYPTVAGLSTINLGGHRSAVLGHFSTGGDAESPLR